MPSVIMRSMCFVLSPRCESARLFAPSQHNSRPQPALASIVAVLLLWTSACASRGGGLPANDAEAEWTPQQLERLGRLEKTLSETRRPRESASLRILLAFDEAADLDLYVTDPLQETVYFANSPSRSGGRLLADVRCDSPAVRVEEIEFGEPVLGRYRVGVDFPERCAGSPLPRKQRRQGVYAVRIDFPGASETRPPIFQRGITELGRFEVILLEFELEP